MGWCSNLEGRERWEKILGMGILRGPVVHTPCFHCRRLGFDPWWGNLDPASHKGVIKESLSLALPLLCQLGLQFPVYMGWESYVGGVEKRQSFRPRESTLHKRLPAAGCVRESRGVCVCVGICTLHLYASHSGRRRKEKCCFYTSVNTRLKRTFLTPVSLISPTHFCYSSNQYIFTEHLLGIWHCDRHWDYIDEQERHSLRLQGAHSLWRRQVSEWEDAILRQGTWIRIGHGGEGVTW